MNNEQNLEAQFYRQGYSKESGEIFKDSKPKSVRLSTVQELLDMMRERAKLGNKLERKDDPQRLMVGFLDLITNQWFKIRIVDLRKTIGDLPSEEKALVKLQLLTSEGRDLLFKHN